MLRMFGVAHRESKNRKALLFAYLLAMIAVATPVLIFSVLAALRGESVSC